jgi:outer membrane protein TolC
VVEAALRNSSDTRASWAAARAARAAYESRRGDWLPDLGASAGAVRSQSPNSRGEEGAVLRRDDLTADLSFLLFNFGGRWAAIEEERQAFLAADWTHNETVMDVIFQAEQSYYQYVATQALLEAQRKVVEQAQANLEAAQARHDAGLATIADVLQAKTARSQAQLSLDDLEGGVLATRGALATAMGLPATTDVDVPLELPPPPADSVADEVERFLEEALRSRPDLASARALVESSRAHVRRVKAAGRPALTFGGSAGRSYFETTERYGDSWSAALQVRVPLFTGLSQHQDVRRAQAERDAAQARLQKLEQVAILEVWTAHADLRTARQRLRTSADLLASAQASEEVAAGRYREGVGSILDLLSAESALGNALAQQILARTDWYVSLARLSLVTGALGTTQEGKPDDPRP